MLCISKCCEIQSVLGVSLFLTIAAPTAGSQWQPWNDILAPCDPAVRAAIPLEGLWLARVEGNWFLSLTSAHVVLLWYHWIERTEVIREICRMIGCLDMLHGRMMNCIQYYICIGYSSLREMFAHSWAVWSYSNFIVIFLSLYLWELDDYCDYDYSQ